MNMHSKVTIVIPARNEECTIGTVIDAVRPYGAEIVVIDDHSIDNTRIIAEQKGVKVLSNLGRPGKGFAIRLAIDYIKSDIILFIDADSSHKNEDIPKLLKPILDGKADMVVASRIKGGSGELFTTFAEIIRLAGVIISSAFVNLMWKTKLTDIHNGFRAIKLDTAKQLDLKEPRFAIEQEMTIKILKAKKNILEIPSYEFKRQHGESKLNVIVNLFDCLRCLLRNI